MIQLDNKTGVSAELFPGWSRTGQRQQTLVVKSGFKFDEKGKLRPTTLPIIDADEYRDDPENSSLCAAGEIMPYKQGAELYLYGSAQPTAERFGSRGIAVSLQQEQQHWHKELQIFGIRHWQKKLLTAIPAKPQALDSELELGYEKAYGGFDPHNKDAYCAANPAGCGYSLRGLRTSGLTLPQIEYCNPQICAPGDRVQPAGFGPLAPHWELRSQLKYSIDEQAVSQGLYPFASTPPEELFNVAPLDQRFKMPFASELTLKLSGLIRGANVLQLEIVREIPNIRVEGIGPVHQLQAKCDTMVIDCHQQTIAFIQRAAIVLDESNPDPQGWITLTEPQMQRDRQVEQERV